MESICDFASWIAMPLISSISMLRIRWKVVAFVWENVLCWGLCVLGLYYVELVVGSVIVYEMWAYV